MNEHKPEWYERLKAYPFDRKTFTIGKIYKIEKLAAEGDFDIKGQKRLNRLAVFAGAAFAVASAVVLFVAAASNGKSIPLKSWVQTTAHSPEKSTKTNIQHHNNQGAPNVQKYISENEALQIAKKMDPNGKAEWSIEFVKDAEVDPDKKEIRPCWKVTATYPPGNKMIEYIDAVSGKLLAETEIESNW